MSLRQTQAMGKKWFGDWTASGAKPETTLPPAPLSEASAVNVANAEKVQDSIRLAEELPMNRFDPDYYTLQLGNHVLGGGLYATRLYRDLREETGFVYTVDVASPASKSRARNEVAYKSDPRNVLKARTRITRDRNRMRTDLVSSEELHQAKALLLRQLPLSESSEEAVAGGFLARAKVGLSLDETYRAAEQYAALTTEAMRTAFQRHAIPANLVQVVEGPAPQ